MKKRRKYSREVERRASTVCIGDAATRWKDLLSKLNLDSGELAVALMEYRKYSDDF